MATIKRVSPLKPGLRGARNWVTAQMRGAQYSRKGTIRFFIGLFVIFFAILLLALWLGGFLPDAQKSSKDMVKNRLMSMGFVVEHVDVLGEGAISEKDVVRALGVNSGDYLFGRDLKKAQNRIENITWVERAIVRRLWPNRIVVQIIERKPYALWQNSGNFYIVDKNGSVISAASLTAYSDLPLIVGEDAPTEFTELQSVLSDFDDVKLRVSALVHHNTGRWDLMLNKGAMRVKLPAENPRAALQLLAKLQSSQKIMDRQISAIDLRLPDRISLSAAKDEPA